MTKTTIESAKYKIKKLLLVLTVFGRSFFMDPDFRIESAFLADPNPDSGKKNSIRIRKKVRIRKHCQNV